MTMVNRHHLIIPYGVNRWNKDTFFSSFGENNTLILNCNTRYVLIDPLKEEPLRLNDNQYEFHETPNMRLLPTIFDQLSFLETHLHSLCGTWSKFQHLFITKYFDFIIHRLKEEKEYLSGLIKPFGNLYNHHDWAFSAFRPLPQSYIFAPKEVKIDKPPNSDDFIAVDITIWTGTKTLALFLKDLETSDPFKKNKLRRIRNSGINIIDIPALELEKNHIKIFSSLLPKEVQDFWNGEIAPSRPFVNTRLNNTIENNITF